MLKIKTSSLAALAAVALFSLIDVAAPAAAQVTGSYNDDTQVLIAQIQADKRAIVLKTLNLTDAEVIKFTPIYDKYQADRKKQLEQTSDLINKFVSNYDTMTDDAAKSIMKDFFKLQEARTDLVKDYSKKFAAAIPQQKVLRWVQVENKLQTLLDVQAAANIPLVR
jgi:Spy/CpxP family protein refolding chaperone